MQLIRCTTKLLKEVGVKPHDLEQTEPTFSFLGQWHANLLLIERKKCVLFVNDRTLFNFIVPGVIRAQIRSLGCLFRDHLRCALANEGFSEQQVDQILSEYDDLKIAKSSDRSVLGCSNDFAFHYKYQITRHGGIHSWKVPEIIREMNRMPMHAATPRSMFPIRELKSLCGNAV